MKGVKNNLFFLPFSPASYLRQSNHSQHVGSIVTLKITYVSSLPTSRISSPGSGSFRCFKTLMRSHISTSKHYLQFTLYALNRGISWKGRVSFVAWQSNRRASTIPQVPRILHSVCVSVNSGCCHRIPQTTKYLFLTVLEAEASEIRAPADSVYGEGPLPSL